MTINLKTTLDSMAGGLFLMSIFTAGLIALAEYNLNGRDYAALGIVFVVIVSVFISYYLKFSNAAKTLASDFPGVKSADEKKKDKWFMIIGALEGLAIFLTANVLINIKLFNYFVPAMALIVGLHFFPLGYIFKRSFDYFMGIWTCVVAFTGMILIKQHLAGFEVIALVSTGCAIATSLYGIRMIAQGRNAMQQSSLLINS
ncbi:long-chain fatty acid--CoA ligase [Mucilaginibacter agri]|uniref:Uncharacterized protein n=1 Tax=Mucilaginibacter agri TaxID=2695265 RepID=A0A965ZG45_9SPHI|nr:long-chain fatty acid--CoA ligase [Mucilaginibacter agri]NCD69374.1 hypothetical protein [Mucilaginibacter agri]